MKSENVWGATSVAIVSLLCVLVYVIAKRKSDPN